MTDGVREQMTGAHARAGGSARESFREDDDDFHASFAACKLFLSRFDENRIVKVLLRVGGEGFDLS